MCSHDSHGAMLLGAARILKDIEAELKGTVKLLFQPGEETGAGARLMVENGVLRIRIGRGLRTACAAHRPDRPDRLCSGVNSSSLDTFILKIHGRGGHSSQPHLCTDPLADLNQIYQAVNLLVTREADPAATVALTCGVAKGGTAVNIIPDEAQLHIGLRTQDVAAAEHLKQRIPELIDHYVKAWNGTYDLTVFHTPCTYSDEKFCAQAVPYIREIAGEENVFQIPPMSGTEDFGYITAEVPGMFAFIGAGNPGMRRSTARRWCWTRKSCPPVLRCMRTRRQPGLKITEYKERGFTNMAQKSKKTTGFRMPHVFIILLLIMLFVVVLSYIIPSGTYERLENVAGITVIDPDTFHYVENDTPITFMNYFEAVYNGFVNGATIMGTLFICSGVIYLLEASGAFGRLSA